MRCERCQAELPADASFCPACGALAPDEHRADAVADEGSPAAASDPAAEEHARAQERYQAELAEYERQKAAYDQQYAPQPPPFQEQPPPFQAQPQPVPLPGPEPKKRKTGLIIGIIALVVFLLCGCGLAAVFGLRSFIESQPSIEELQEGYEEDTWDDGAWEESDGGGYATAEEALQARLDEDAMGDWVYEVADEADGYVTYIVGPPASEYTLQYFVEQYEDGTWWVTDVIDLWSDEGMEDSQYLAEDVVWQYLFAVWEDQGLAAQSFTTEPFSSDPASAMEAAGDLEDINVEGSTENADGSYWVQTTQVWRGENEQWEYLVVPTDDGYKISECRPW